MRVDCGLVVTVKVARAGLPDCLTQPGKKPSIWAGVRSASTEKRPSRSDVTATRPLSWIGMAPPIVLAGIESEIGAHGLVEHALNVDVGVSVGAHLAIFEAWPARRRS